MNSNRNVVIGVIALFFIVHLVLVFRINYTTDAGDSVMHFLFAKWAFLHPENFVDHWAKPLFVMLSAPLAQFGFEGMSIFNLLVYVGALIYTDKFCRRIGIIYSCVPVSLMAVFIFSNQIVHSGLTEPLGCLLMIASFYYLSERKYLLGTIIMSFSPFVRSEGLILCGTVGLFFLVIRELKWIPLLITGHLVFAVIGALFFHKTFLWVFTEIPYAHGNGGYGSGPWDHFIHYMPRTIGTIPALLWELGILWLVAWPFLKKKPIEMDSYQKKVFWVLVVCAFTFFFGFHVVSWAKGLFNSFGLLRVLVVIFPQMAIIAALPLLYVIKLGEQYLPVMGNLGKWLKGSRLVYLIIICILMVNFEGENGFLNKRQFSLDRSQVAENQLYDYIKAHYPDYKKKVFVSSARYIPCLFGLDHFDKKRSQDFIEYAQHPEATPSGSILIWDNWFSVVENGMPYVKLSSDTTLRYIVEFKQSDNEGEARVVAFEKK